MNKCKANIEEFELEVIEQGLYFVRNNTTIRATAKHFKTSKSNIHKHIRKELPLLSMSLYNKCLALITINTLLRTSRGGQATSLKYSKKALDIITTKEIISSEDYNKDLIDEYTVLNVECVGGVCSIDKNRTLI